MTVAPSANLPRVDAADMVRGTLRYSADDSRPGMLHGLLVLATIGLGRVTDIQTTAAERLAGVRLVLTHLNVGPLSEGGFVPSGNGYGFQSLQPLRSADIAYRGQPIAMVVAESLETAYEAAALVSATYDSRRPVSAIDQPGAEAVDQAKVLPQPVWADKVVGNVEPAMAAATVRVAATYRCPVQHQNPMELIATVAEWEQDTLVVHEPTQAVDAIRHGLARQLSMDAAKIRVISSSVGGSFGQKNSLQSQTVLAAIAARRLGRPVKIVMPRAHLFHTTSFRPMSIHRVEFGAGDDGRITAAVHEIDQQTSRHDLLFSPGTEVTARLYAIPNFRGHDRLIKTDVQTPGFMRAPFEHPAAYAFECALDEMAYALKRDPVALRLAHDTPTDPLTGKPFSSRHLAACLIQGAERFGWRRRSAQPRSMQSADGTLIGWGMAAGSYKASTAPVMARVKLNRDGSVDASVGVHEMGQGVRTAVAAELAHALGVPGRGIRIVMGDTAAMPHHITAGSWGTATAVPVVTQAAQQIVAQLRQRAGDAPAAMSALELLRASGAAAHEVEVKRRVPGHSDQVFARLDRGLQGAVGPAYPEFISFSYVAHFVEVHVDPRTRAIRVPRVVSVADCGRVVSERTARSQLLGGVVWGIGAALRELSETDPRFGGFLNADLAEYVLPVAADIGSIHASFVNEPDTRLNASGVKGLGEVALVGVAPAIANAVFHATGKRVRHLPIRFEDLL